MTLGQLRMGARQTKNAPLGDDDIYAQIDNPWSHDTCLMSIVMMMMMIDCEVLIHVKQICNQSFLSVPLSQHFYFPSSWAPQARSEAREVYPGGLYPPDDPHRPSRPKAGLGLVMILITMIMMMIMPWNGWWHSWCSWVGQLGQLWSRWLSTSVVPTSPS